MRNPIIGLIAAALMLIATGCTDASSDTTTPTDGSASPPGETAVPNDVVVLTIEKYYPPRPDPPQNPVIEIRADGTFLRWDDVRGRHVTGTLDVESITSLLEAAGSAIIGLEEDYWHPRQATDGITTKVSWELTDGAAGSTQWYSSASTFPELAPLAEVLTAITESVNNGEGSEAQPNGDSTPSTTVVLSLHTARGDVGVPWPNPVFELTADGSVITWDGALSTPRGVNFALSVTRQIASIGAELDENYGDRLRTHCPQTTFRWTSSDGVSRATTVECVGLFRSPTEPRISEGLDEIAARHPDLRSLVDQFRGLVELGS